MMSEKSIVFFKHLPIPPVDTYLVYGNYYVNDVGFDNSNKNKTRFDDDEYLGSGVPYFSSLLIGMKLLYDKKLII